MKNLAGFWVLSIAVLASTEACKDKTAPVVFDAGPPIPAPTATMADLEPMIEDAGLPPEDADAAKPKGPGITTNQARVLQCCNQIAAAGKALGAGSAEGGILTQQAASCKALATQMGPNATGAELAPVRGLLKTVKIPGLCSGI